MIPTKHLLQWRLLVDAAKHGISYKPQSRQRRLMALFAWLLSVGVDQQQALERMRQEFGDFDPDQGEGDQPLDNSNGS